MSKAITTLLCVCTFSVSTAMPAPVAAQTSASTRTVSSSLTNCIETLPTRVPSFLVGAVGGVPIAMVRKTVKGATDTAKIGLEDRKYKWLMIVPTFVLGVPLAAVGGFIDGPFCSLHNAWVYSADHPFSKEAFSLGELEDTY